MAALALAYAYALAGQPDSARAEAVRLAASPDTARQRLGRQLGRQLAAGNFSLAKNPPAALPGVIATATSIGALRQLAAAAAARPAPAGTETLRQARLAELENKSSAAGNFYARLLRAAPFNEPAMLAAASFYTRRRNYPAAYEALRRGLEENPESVALLEAYMLAAVRAGLNDYAADALARLRLRLSPAAYATLQQRLAQTRAARVAANASFAPTP